MERGVLADAECAPRFRPDDSIDIQAAVSLKALDRSLGFRSERAVRLHMQCFLETTHGIRTAAGA
jgi:hypothetical protein